MRKNIQHITLDKIKETVSINNLSDTVPFVENIQVKTVYNPGDTEALEHLDFGAGFAPYTRGIYPTMYITHPWQVRKYVNPEIEKNTVVYPKQYIDAKKYNADTIFNLSSVNKPHHSVHINTVDDMKDLLKSVPANIAAFSIASDSNLLPLMAFYVLATEEIAIENNEQRGFINDDVLYAVFSGEEDFYGPEIHEKIISDISEYTKKQLPMFNAICISGTALQKAGSNTAIELAYTLLTGLKHLINDKTKPVSFSWSVGMNHFLEIAKIRAARMLWVKLVHQVYPNEKKLKALHIHSHTDNANTTPQDPFNNITRNCIEALTAVLGGTQSLHINAFNEISSLYDSHGCGLAYNTHAFLQHETKITKTVDPLGGSYYVEHLTNEIVHSAWIFIEEIKTYGGILNAVKAGIPQLRVKEAVEEKQSNLNNVNSVIVGGNKYQLKSEKQSVLITNKDDRTSSDAINRDTEKIRASLNTLSKCVLHRESNLFTLALEAARNGATLQEIKNALKQTNL